MSLIEIIMPKMGESIMEATILKWNKNVGDTIKMDETLLEIATDKVDSEVPCTAEGTVSEILFKENDVVAVGTVIAKITSSGVAASENKPSVEAQPQTQHAVNQPVSPNTIITSAPIPVSSTPSTSSQSKFYSPLVLNIASSEGISMSELEQIPGTGNEGRVTKKDIKNYIANKKSGPQTQHIAHTTTPLETPKETTHSASTASPSIESNTANSYTGQNVEIVEMDRMRKLIADHMVRSKATSPHVTSFTEADVTNIVLWRNKIKNAFEKKYQEKITFTPIFIEAIIKAMKKFPMINASVEGNQIIVKKDFNIGMAAALPSGNLIVPVIKNADTKNLFGLTKEVNLLANNARTNKLKPDDTQGGTFTLTNVGTFGSLMGTPIINQPQVAILAVGAIKKRPMVLETEHGDVIAIRHMMYLSLSYDHRIVDGSLGAGFLTEVANALEAFDDKRDI
ncbi:MAG: dihydrolipoamide acetyltransferase family protein [Chitinophagaceae bacterium]